MSKTIYITKLDLERLREVVNSSYKDSRNHKYIELLKEELDKAQVVEPKDIPGDVISMRSKVLLADDHGKEITIQLVYPDEADISSGKISVLAPVGTAILGERVGQNIDWEVPGGIKTYTIKEILYQPESSGNYEE